MAKRSKNLDCSSRVKPAITPEAREQQLIAEAIDCAERQMLDGTASSQVITHFLKLGSSKNQLEIEKLRNENALLEAKRISLEQATIAEELYSEAIEAMRRYSGQS